MAYPIINCPICNGPIELRHIPGKPTIEAVAAKRENPPAPVKAEPDDAEVSAIHQYIDEANAAGSDDAK